MKWRPIPPTRIAPGCLIALTWLVLASCPASAALQPLIKKAGWEEASSVLERWLQVQGFSRPASDILPRASMHEILHGDEKQGIKVRFVEAGRAYRLVAEWPGGQRYGEIGDGNYGYWHLNEILGNGKLYQPGREVQFLRHFRYSAAVLRERYSTWSRLPDRQRDGKNCHVVAMQLTLGSQEYWWFDAETGVLLVTDTTSTDGQLIGRVRFSDFRMTNGVLEPHTIVDGEGPNRTTLHTTAIQNRATVPAGFFALEKPARERWEQTEEILKKYVQACGGALALAQVVTRVTRASGENTTSGVKFEVTLSQKSPAFYLSETKVEGLGRSWVGFDGETGWELSEVKGFRAMRGAELDLLRRNGQLNTENISRLFPLRRLEGMGSLDGRRVVAVELSTMQAKAGMHYFEVESGQLVRIEATIGTPGESELPVTIDFSDFRTVDEVVLPFHTVLSNPAMRIVTKIESVQHNIELDHAIFKPRKEE